MNITDFMNAMESIMELDEGSLKENDILDKLAAWDSLAVLGYVTFVDEAFQRSISAENIRKARTIKDLYLLTQV